jgi:AraC-like DNA-binding protein
VRCGADDHQALEQLCRYSPAQRLPTSACKPTPRARWVTSCRDGATHLVMSPPVLVIDLARQAGLSLDRFAASYKAQTGRTPHQFVLALRLERSCVALRESTLIVADAAPAGSPASSA